MIFKVGMLVPVHQNTYLQDLRTSGLLRGVTSQKSEDIIYTVAEAWNHT